LDNGYAKCARGIWKDAGKRMQLKDIAVSEVENSIQVSSIHFDSLSSTTIFTKYKIYNEGAIHLDRKIEILDNTLPEIPRIGVKLSMLGSFNNVTC
jgi:Beta galactosidase small chain.